MRRVLLAVFLIASILGAAVLPMGAASPHAGARPSAFLVPALSSPMRQTHPSTANSLGSSPPFLQRMAMVDDPADGHVLVFGGQTNSLSPTNETLTYSNGTWNNLTSVEVTAPPARWGAGAAFDPIDHAVVLFGGCQTAACYPALADTWLFQGGAWHDVTSTAGVPPSGRGFGMMTWDAADSRVLLFGGEVGGGVGAPTYDSDFWSFQDGNWTNLTPAHVGPAPSGRAFGVMASNSSGPAVLFGGRDFSGVLSDTWTFHSGNWTNVTSLSTVEPAPRSGAMFAPFPPGGGLELFGGYSSAPLNDQWLYKGGNWSSVAASGPAPTYGAGMVYDSEDSYLLLYGGIIVQSGQTGTTNAYWSYSAGSWHLWNPLKQAPIDWLVFLPILVILLILGIEIPVLSRRQNRRLAQLSGLMPAADPTTVWTPTRPVSVLRRNTWMMAGIFFAIFIPVGSLLTVTLLATSRPQDFDNTLVLILGEWALFIGLPIMILTSRIAVETRAIGVSDSGVTVRRKRTEVRIPWEYLQPPVANPKGPLVYFQFALPGKQAGANGFGATHEQARAIIGHPRAAGWAVPPPVRSALGLTPPLVPTGSLGQGAGVGSPIPTAWPQTPVPAQSGSTPFMPGFNPAATNPAHVLVPAPPSASVPPAGGVAQVRRCPRCSRLAGLRARFCPNCGAFLG